MKKILGLTLAGALLVAALPAVAADYPVKAPPPLPLPIWSWTGFYIGVNAGAGRSTAFLLEAGGFSNRAQSKASAIVGGTLGWNWQNGPLVIGVEGDFDWANIRTTGFGGCFLPDCRTRIDWLATVRGRIGFAHGPLLVYLTGGAAFASVFGQEGTPPFVVVGGNGTVTASGWTGGGGLEGALGGGWSVKGEYLYVNLGKDLYFTQVAPFGATTFDIRLRLVRAGLNYKF